MKNTYITSLLIINTIFSITAMESPISDQDLLNKQLIESFAKDKQEVDLVKIKNLINNGADVNSTIYYDEDEFFFDDEVFFEDYPEDDFSAFLLHKVVTLNNRDAIKILINAGANVNARDTYNRTPLNWAIKSKASLDIIKLLLEYGADANAQAKDDGTPLYWAILTGAGLDVVKLLIEHGADVNIATNEDDNQDYLIHYAIEERGDLDIVKLLVANGADLYVLDNEGRTALNLADHHLKFDILRFLITQVSCLDKDANENTTLHWAAASGDIDHVRRCIENNAEINAQNDSGYTPLHFAIMKAYRIPNQTNIEVINFLIDKGAEVNIQHEYAETPLVLAAEFRFSDIVKTLLNRGAKVNFKGQHGNTPLHGAVITLPYTGSCNTDIIKILLSWFTLPQVKPQASTFINETDNKEIWDLKNLALMNLLKNNSDYDKFDDNYVASYLATYPTLLNDSQKILLFIDLQQKRIRQIITSSDEKDLKDLIDFSKQQHFEHLKQFIAMKNDVNQTALDIALESGEPNDCNQLLQAVTDAQKIDDLPDDLTLMIEENIKKVFSLNENANIKQDLIEDDDRNSKKRKITQVVNLENLSTTKKRKLNPLENIQEDSDFE